MSCVMFRWCTRAVEWNWAISRALWQRAWYWSYRALWQRAWYWSARALWQRAWYWSSRALWQRAWYWLSRTLWWKRWYVLLQLRRCDVTLWLWRSDTKPWMWYCDIVVWSCGLDTGRGIWLWCRGRSCVWVHAGERHVLVCGSYLWRSWCLVVSEL